MIKADMINELKDKVIDGYSISRDEALLLADTPDSRLDELCRAADEIQRHFLTMTSICVPS